MHGLLCLPEAPNGTLWVSVNHRLAHPLAHQRSRDAMQRNRAKAVALAQPEETELRRANARRIP